MAHIPGYRPYTVTHKSRVTSYIHTHAHKHPECRPWRHRGKPHRLSPRARARQQAAAEACCCLCIKAQPRCTDPRQSATSRAHATVRPRLGSQDGTLCGGGTWDVAAGGPSSMRSTGWMVSMSCSATGAPPSLVQHQHLFAPSAGRSVPRCWVPYARACTARAPSSPLIPAPGAMTRVRESACGGVAVPR